MSVRIGAGDKDEGSNLALLSCLCLLASTQFFFKFLCFLCDIFCVCIYFFV